MITATAKQRVKPEKEDELIALMQDLTTKVRANEPGCTIFEYVRFQDQANTFLVIEQYENQAAFDAHHATDYLAEFIPKLMDCLTEAPEIILYEDVLDRPDTIR